MSASDPKLIQARQEIEEICAKYDIAAFVILHNAPGNSEHWMSVSPSYSRLRMERMPNGADAVRIQSKLSDYNGDAAAQKRDLEATANLLSHFALTAGQAAIPLLEISTMLDKRLGATHTEGTHTPTPPKGAH